MKKLIIGCSVIMLLLTTVSCGGGGHTCDAYRKADYTKKQSKKAVVKTQIKKVISLKK